MMDFVVAAHAWSIPPDGVSRSCGRLHDDAGDDRADRVQTLADVLGVVRRRAWQLLRQLRRRTREALVGRVEKRHVHALR